MTVWLHSTRKSVNLINANAKYSQMEADFSKKIGCPDLLVLFTNTVSHKMVKCALDEVGSSTDIVRCHTSSGNALNGILEARC